MNDPAEDPVEDRQRPLIVRQLDSGLDGNKMRINRRSYGFSHDGGGTSRGTHDEIIL